jgi:uncharacterized protein
MNFPSFLAFLLLAAAGRASAEETAVPVLTGRVNDDANILSASAVSSLEHLLKTHEDSTTNQVVVLTVPGLAGGESIEQFSIRVADAWKIGQKGKDNGVLLIIASEDRKVRIEVGRGLEGSLPDITCGSIIRHEIIPRFKNGDYDGGVTAGVSSILAAIAGDYTASADDHSGPMAGDTAGLIIGLTLFTVVVGTFTVIGVLLPGGMSWFLYAFLIPFWAAFPMALLGTTTGLTMLAIYAVGFPLVKLLLPRTAFGKRMAKSSAWTGKGGVSGWSSSSSSGGWSSSSSSSFSGGGGGFSGGGASGSW